MDKATVSGSDLPKLVAQAMTAIEEDFKPLEGVLPKDYGIFEPKVLEDLMRLFNGERIKQASGDVFGRIYQYFLAKFSVQKAHDNGEFFTPSSLVQLIVNVIEPDHGTAFDPACGSGGMFVQSSHFIEQEGEDTAKKVVFYGQEKNPTTIHIAKMNLAVHGLEGKIAEAITYYQDEHTLFGKCDFVMANPPFNVDLVDAKRIATDVRLPFGLPAVNKAGKVSNGNYLWISYFWSYLNEKGRAGFVMSSQASSAGHGEKDVRRKIVETGDVDVMISIRSNFFYTRSVPCELWFIDRGKPDQPSSPSLLPSGEGRKVEHYRGAYDFAGLTKRARELRKKQTRAEDLFWALVRDRQFLGLKFRRQHQLGDYILDFYCHEQQLGVEFDGKIHQTRLSKDAKRDSYLASQGVKVVRIPNETFLSDPASALEYLRDQLPLPLGEGRGEGKSSGPLNTKDKILMIDARNIYRKVTRKIYDFSPEQMQNLSAIIWLYRGQCERFLKLIERYVAAICDEGREIGPKIDVFERTLAELCEQFVTLSKNNEGDSSSDEEKKKAFTNALTELVDAERPYESDRDELLAKLAKFFDHYVKNLPNNNDDQHAARKTFDPIAEEMKGLIKQIDLLYKLTARAVDLAAEMPAENGNGDRNKSSGIRTTRRLLKQLEEHRKAAVEQLKQAAYFHRQVSWLQERFPGAELQAVSGLVKLVDRTEIESADWSLTPGRYVGVAPAEEDEDFDFEGTLRDIHTELVDLNKQAADLAAKIQQNLVELGA
jgi:type I restriction-modification system DNA methylase subunit